MIDIDGVTRENFDSSGLSTGYAVATQISEIEGEILGLIRGVFEGLPDVPVRDTDTSAVRSAMLARVSGIQAQATELFAAARNELFGSLNRSLENGYAVGQRSGAVQTGREAAGSVIADSPYGKETVRTANRNLLQAEATAVTGAVTGLVSGIALLTGGALLLSDMTYKEAYDHYVVPEFMQGLPGKHTSDGRSISLTELRRSRYAGKQPGSAAYRRERSGKGGGAVSRTDIRPLFRLSVVRTVAERNTCRRRVGGR